MPKISHYDAVAVPVDSDVFYVIQGGRSRKVTYATLKAHIIAVADVFSLKGAIDCSVNPDFPAADAGDTYRITAGGLIGGAGGVTVQANDILYCCADSTPAGDYAAVGACWGIAQGNLDIDTDQAMAANSDLKVPSQKAARAFVESERTVWKSRSLGMFGSIVLAPDSSPVQFLDPHGSDRDVHMPDPAACADRFFLIVHCGDDISLLTMKSNGNPVGYLRSFGAALMFCTGSVWHAFSLLPQGNSYYPFIFDAYADKILVYDLLELMPGSGITLRTSNLTSDRQCVGIMDHGWAGENLVFGDLVYLNSAQRWVKADAGAEATAKGMLGLAAAAISQNDPGLVLLRGYARDDSWILTGGAPQFVSTTAGAITETAPSGTGEIVRLAGYARTAAILNFDPSKDWHERT
jgi:hypothetical protein